MADYDLVVAAIRGDQTAFKQLVTLAISRVYPVAYQMLRNKADADDVIQSSVSIALNKIRTLKKPGSFDAWFRSVVTNQALGLIRKRRRDPTPLDPDGPYASKSPDIDRLIDLRDAVAELPQYYRRILMLSTYGLSTAEIATVIDRPAGTARRHVSEAYELVRNRMTLGDDLEYEAL